ncbi:MAG TPA: glycosyltransferase family 4 protein [Symbiobacteriaceae bacterium]|nr:glycosyltransferase family 4 protein [Symbiobacteriaceae bacterium]
MRILIASGFTHPQIGGVSSYLETLQAEGLAAGHSLDIVSASDIPRYRTLMSKGLAAPKALVNRNAAWHQLNMDRVRSLALVIQRQLSRQSYDIVNAQCVWSCAALTMAKVREIPVLLTLHGYAADETAAFARNEAERAYRVKVMRELERLAYKSAHGILTVDGRIAEHAKTLGAPSGAVRVILNRPDSSFQPALKQGRSAVRKEYSVSEPTFVVLCPRRLVPKNGVRYAIKAMAFVRQQYPDCLLFVAGEGEERSDLEKLARENGLADVVRFLGSVDRGRIPALYGMVDCVVVPSATYLNVQEATSISALEGMAVGVPVVASAIGGLREIITDGETGILVPEAEPTALGTAIIKLATDALLRRRVTDNAAAFVKAHAANWFGQYQSAVENAINRFSEVSL